MTAYVISEVIIRDPGSVATYKPIAQASIAEYGGRYLARDAVPATLEGTFDPRQRIVIVEFDRPESLFNNRFRWAGVIYVIDVCGGRRVEVT